MTEHSRIPLTDHESDQSKGVAPTLIERVTRGLDLASLAPPPIPDELKATPQRQGRRYRRDSEAEPVPAASQPLQTGEHAPVEAAPAGPVTTAVRPLRLTADRQAVDRNHLRDHGMIVPEGNVSALLEEFRIIKRQLLLNVAQLREKGMGPSAQRILICSPHPGEGKTYTAVNLALAIAAEKECEVLLVDADFAKPSVLSTLGLAGSKGLMDALANPALDVAECVVGTDVGGLWVLPAGNATNSDSEYLSASRCRDVLDRLVAGAPNRIVIFDSPPALAASPAAELAKHAGQALLIARADSTGQGALEDAVSLLSGCPNVQLLLNGTRFSPSGRRFGAYYGYGD